MKSTASDEGEGERGECEWDEEMRKRNKDVSERGEAHREEEKVE